MYICAVTFVYICILTYVYSHTHVLRVLCHIHYAYTYIYFDIQTYISNAYIGKVVKFREMIYEEGDFRVLGEEEKNHFEEEGEERFVNWLLA